MDKLRLQQQVSKETLRLHSPIHTLLRKVKNPLSIPGTDWVVPRSHTLLASPLVTSKSKEYFEDRESWSSERWNSQVTPGIWSTTAMALSPLERRVPTCHSVLDDTDAFQHNSLV
ncbi:hypothetical protein EPUS_09333 [Endocarpon pusillum Z07020]|uniref:Uncharacterized protein n=1 Tax=Endocarpon pusillum (strain Z07020 / HMAS-L-300199) TaxID=1263415 RepID=U1HQK0_ENDPU|nr:uncharacterized protein EPUS_09333 [Endocarpon pusillum Z07020]ERF71369.1 hypothetical protein EPUS_09333 [Endocarpon pusillum Z07020]